MYPCEVQSCHLRAEVAVLTVRYRYTTTPLMPALQKVPVYKPFSYYSNRNYIKYLLQILEIPRHKAWYNLPYNLRYMEHIPHPFDEHTPLLRD